MATKNYVDYDPKTNTVVERTVNENVDGTCRSTETTYEDSEQMADDFVKQINELLDEYNVRGGLLVGWDDKDRFVAAGSDLNGDREEQLTYGIGQMMAHNYAHNLDVTENVDKFYKQIMALTTAFQAGMLSELSDSARGQMLQFMKNKVGGNE